MMPREEIIKQLKPYFNVKELVCNHIYGKFGEQSWMFLSTQLLHVLLCLRTDILRMPMHINTGTMHQRGMRCNLCPLVKSKKNVYVRENQRYKLVKSFQLETGEQTITI